jgi:hypothetical protein
LALALGAAVVQHPDAGAIRPPAARIEESDQATFAWEFNQNGQAP